jgi:AcrR family transcriptional regulator
MGRPRKKDITTATTERILVAAQAHFSKVGFKAARLADIANDAGITRPSLLYHFSSKEKLYNQVVENTFEQLLALLSEAATTEGEFSEVIEGLVDTYVEFLEKNPYVAGIVIREFAFKAGRGQEILLQQIAPILDWVETLFLQSGAGTGGLRQGLPIRAAIMQIVSDAMLRALYPPVSALLWGEESKSRELAKILFFEEDRSSPRPES